MSEARNDGAIDGSDRSLIRALMHALIHGGDISANIQIREILDFCNRQRVLAEIFRFSAVFVFEITRPYVRTRYTCQRASKQ